MTELTTQRSGKVSPLSLLIADDSSAMRAVLRHLIEECGDQWRVCAEAFDGRDAIQKAASLRPDAILLDLSIPALSGLEAAKVLQRDCPTCELILMSAQEPAVLDRLAASAKVRYFISKASLGDQFVPLMQRISVRTRNSREAA